MIGIITGSKHCLLVCAITGLMILSGLPFLTDENTWIGTEAIADSYCTTLSSGDSEITLTFNPGGGSDTSAKLLLPKQAQIISASFNVTGSADTGNEYPTNVKLDVGDDGDREWEFNLTGAGSLGKQYQFVGGSSNKMLRLTKGGFDNKIYIRLPRNAVVVAAQMDLSGYYHGVKNNDFSTGTMTGWTTVTNTNSDTVVVQNTRGGNDPPVSWGAAGDYLMLRSNPFGSHDSDCDLNVVSDAFPNLDTDYITMDWDLVENDYFTLNIRVEDDASNIVTAISFGPDNEVNHVDTKTKQVVNIQSLTGQNLKVRLTMVDGDWGFPNFNDWGRTAIDNINISDASGNSLPVYPMNVTVDVGLDGTKEYQVNELKGTKTMYSLMGALNGLLANPSPACQITSDNYGNEFLDIPLNVSVLDSPGLVNLTNLEIQYLYDATVGKNPRGNLAGELNSLIPTSGVGNVIIPIAVSSSSGGNFKISNINIKYNAVPKSVTIPVIKILEDSLNPQKLDLDDYFTDDSDPLDLDYAVAENSEPTKLEAFIETVHYLTLNANKEPDWYGNVTVVIRATDAYGLFVESNKFIVSVEPVNDEPRTNIPLAKVTMMEDSKGVTIDLGNVPYFTDIEGDQLYYSAMVDPDALESDPNLNLSVGIENGNQLTIKPGSNWYGLAVPVILFCDDDNTPVNTTAECPHQLFDVDVLPINDMPEIILPEILYLNEDEDKDNWLNLETASSDVETPDAELVFTILSNDNEQNINVTVDTDHYIDIDIVHEDYVGASKVKVQVKDGDDATAEASFRIQIVSENDGPRILVAQAKLQMIEDTSDERSINIFDIFTDPDSPNTYSVFGNKHIAVAISPKNGNVTFKPEKDWYGSEKITFVARDVIVESGGLQQTAEFVLNVTVAPVNDAPLPPGIISPQDPRTNTDEPKIYFECEEATDVDSTELEYYWDLDNSVDSNGDGDPLNDRNGIGRSVEYTYSVSGYYYVTLVVSDGYLNSSPPSGIFVKVTTQFDKVSKKIGNEPTARHSDFIFYILFIIIIIILVLLIFIQRRKFKREQEAKAKADEAKKVKPAIIEGELIGGLRSTTTTGTYLPGAGKTDYILPPGPTKPIAPGPIGGAAPAQPAPPGAPITVDITPPPPPKIDATPAATAAAATVTDVKPIEPEKRQ